MLFVMKPLEKEGWGARKIIIKRFWIVDEIFKETFYQQSICLIWMFISNMLIHLLSVVIGINVSVAVMFLIHLSTVAACI